ncbi:MAG TPA: DUF3226 domain-containing protein [Candidatus Saccharimonadales bacterium]|nr:DUF3226 domain-containing protein [Candidatus Saccharimonadales bacterium]
MKFVFCEGKSDQSVIQSLAAHLELNIHVESTGGKDKLASFLGSLLKRPAFAQQKVNAIGVLRDANGNSSAAFTSVCDALLRNNFTAPGSDGEFSDSELRVGIFIVGVDGRGMIEDVCLKSVSDRPEYSCVDSYFDCIAQKSSRSTFLSKAKFRVWMASHVDHEFHVGKAAEKGYLPWESPVFDPLKKFLRAL